MLGTELRVLAGLLATAKTRLRQLRHHRGDHGYSTEAVVVIALLVVAALAALGIITTKVLDKAQSIQLGG